MSAMLSKHNTTSVDQPDRPPSSTPLRRGSIRKVLALLGLIYLFVAAVVPDRAFNDLVDGQFLSVPVITAVIALLVLLAVLLADGSKDMAMVVGIPAAGVLFAALVVANRLGSGLTAWRGLILDVVALLIACLPFVATLWWYLRSTTDEPTEADQLTSIAASVSNLELAMNDVLAQMAAMTQALETLASKDAPLTGRRRTLWRSIIERFNGER